LLVDGVKTLEELAQNCSWCL